MVRNRCDRHLDRGDRRRPVADSDPAGDADALATLTTRGATPPKSPLISCADCGRHLPTATGTRRWQTSTPNTSELLAKTPRSSSVEAGMLIGAYRVWSGYRQRVQRPSS